MKNHQLETPFSWARRLLHLCHPPQIPTSWIGGSICHQPCWPVEFVRLAVFARRTKLGEIESSNLLLANGEGGDSKNTSWKKTRNYIMKSIWDGWKPVDHWGYFPYQLVEEMILSSSMGLKIMNQLPKKYMFSSKICSPKLFPNIVDYIRIQIQWWKQWWWMLMISLGLILVKEESNSTIDDTRWQLLVDE